jgi:hypothetical protein
MFISGTNERKLRQVFKNNFDCYADTWYYEGVSHMEGEVIIAITEDRFMAIMRECKFIKAQK